MTPYITKSDIQEFKGIAENLNSTKDLDPYIIEAQEFDLRPFLGEAFFIAFDEDFTASPSLETYDDLFNGVTYTYSGDQYRHEGLKAMLIYHAYARYLANANTKSTAYGLVQKNSQHSTPASEKTIARLVSQARSGAMVYQNRVKKYLDINSSTYTLWECGNGKKFRTGKGVRRIG